MLQIRWRWWLTRRYLGAWLANRAYYQLQLKNGVDNPDQRIAEDINQFTNYVLTLSLGVLTSLVTLGSFLSVLWNLSGPADISLVGWGVVHIPGYLVWAALLYAGVGTWLTVKVGGAARAIEFRRTGVRRPDGTPLLRGITLALARGEAVLFTGPTGTGKVPC